MSAYEELRDHIDSLKIIDTHEHLSDEANRPKETDVLAEWLTHYFSCDLVSAGLSDEGLERAKDGTGDLMQRWALVEPYWHAAGSTGYGRALDLAARDIYGIEGVTRDTIGSLNEKFLAAREQGGHYQRVLKDKGGIALSLTDQNLDCDRTFFASVTRLDAFIMPTHRNETVLKGRELGLKIHCLGDWKEAMRLQLERDMTQRGAVAVKMGLAYSRSLEFHKATAADAERDFNELFANAHSPVWRLGIKVGRALQDHMMHHLMTLCDQRGLTVQVHTGIQEGNGNVITDSNPVLLTNLFLEYGDITFDIFHIGYPYERELSNLAKNFRNVVIDMCWAHIISPEAARRALVEFLDAVPANKINAFGGDYCFVDGVYGHQRIARQNVAMSLAQKVEDGSMDLDRAKEIATWVFVDNPVRVFNLKDRLG